MSKIRKEKEKTDNNEIKEEYNIVEVSQPKISIKGWFTTRNIKKLEWYPREIFARKNQMIELTVEEWDTFFKKY